MRCKERDQSQVPGILKAATTSAPKDLRTRVRSDVALSVKSTQVIGEDGVVEPSPPLFVGPGDTDEENGFGQM